MIMDATEIDFIVESLIDVLDKIGLTCEEKEDLGRLGLAHFSYTNLNDLIIIFKGLMDE